VWSRPNVPEINENIQDLIFQVIDIDYYKGGFKYVSRLGRVPTNINTHYSEFGSVLRLYGVTSDGNTMLVHIYGFKPYFYLKAPSSFDAKYIEDLKITLNIALNEDQKSSSLAKVNVLEIGVR
ncbi:hypothetical protein MXB_1803, partial [Myxobolus squamalis]